jgi:diketogulonate reductase-like aldo/keto reductase
VSNQRYRSFWTLRGSPELLSSPTIAELSKKKSITPAQSMFLFAQHLGITPLAGTTDEGRMKEDVDVEKMEPLGEEDQDIVKKLEDAVGI